MLASNLTNIFWVVLTNSSINSYRWSTYITKWLEVKTSFMKRPEILWNFINNIVCLCCYDYFSKVRFYEVIPKVPRGWEEAMWFFMGGSTLAGIFFQTGAKSKVNQGLVKEEKFCFRYLDFYFQHGENTSTASQLR